MVEYLNLETITIKLTIIMVECLEEIITIQITMVECLVETITIKITIMEIMGYLEIITIKIVIAECLEAITIKTIIMECLILEIPITKITINKITITTIKITKTKKFADLVKNVNSCMVLKENVDLLILSIKIKEIIITGIQDLILEMGIQIITIIKINQWVSIFNNQMEME